MVSPKKFILNSNYPIDKIIFLHERTVTTDNDGVATFTMQHGLGATPFCSGNLSYETQLSTETYKQTYSDGFFRLRYFTSGGVTTGDTEEFKIYSNDTQIYVVISIGEPNIQVNVKIWGMFCESETMNIDVSPTSESSSNKFILNSKYTYQSLLKEGKADPDSTVFHGLGYFPVVDVWYYRSDLGMWSKVDLVYSSFDDFSYGAPLVKLTTNDISFYPNGVGMVDYSKFYYRIYSNEAI